MNERTTERTNELTNGRTNEHVALRAVRACVALRALRCVACAVCVSEVARLDSRLAKAFVDRVLHRLEPRLARARCHRIERLRGGGANVGR